VLDVRLIYPLETVRLRLEPFQESDGDALYEMERDPEVKRYVGGVLTRLQTEKLLKKFVESVRQTGMGAIAIKLRGTNRIVGLCGFYGTDVPDQAEIFYGLARDAWGQGYATEAGKALAVAGTQQVGLSSIIASVHPQNVRSMRVLEKIGMRFSHVTTTNELYEVAHVYQLKADTLR
jgi:[ribosomal protein S5]-alanine N-acetyltransferase